MVAVVVVEMVDSVLEVLVVVAVVLAVIPRSSFSPMWLFRSMVITTTPRERHS